MIGAYELRRILEHDSKTYKALYTQNDDGVLEVTGFKDGRIIQRYIGHHQGVPYLAMIIKRKDGKNIFFPSSRESSSPSIRELLFKIYQQLL